MLIGRSNWVATLGSSFEYEFLPHNEHFLTLLERLGVEFEITTPRPLQLSYLYHNYFFKNCIEICILHSLYLLYNYSQINDLKHKFLKGFFF